MANIASPTGLSKNMFVPTNGNFRRVWIQNESADNSECQGYDSYNAVHEFWHHVWIVNNSDFKPVENTNCKYVGATVVVELCNNRRKRTSDSKRND